MKATLQVINQMQADRSYLLNGNNSAISFLETNEPFHAKSAGEQTTDASASGASAVFGKARAARKTARSQFADRQQPPSPAAPTPACLRNSFTPHFGGSIPSRPFTINVPTVCSYSSHHQSRGKLPPRRGKKIAAPGKAASADATRSLSTLISSPLPCAPRARGVGCPLTSANLHASTFTIHA